MKFLLLLNTLVILLILSCQSITYMDPINLTQENIKDIRISYSDGRNLPAFAGRFNDCALNIKNSLLGKNCAILICKNTPNTETGLSCDYHIPKEVDTDQFTIFSQMKAKKINPKFEKISNQIKLDIESGQFNSLSKLCNEKKVICYLNSKYFPSDKITENNLLKLMYKTTFETIAKKSSYNVEIQFYE